MANNLSDDSSRGIRVAGDKIRKLRQNLKWTQQELAERAGYCDRLIRKAEHNGILARETIGVLAQALSDEQQTVTLEDLIRSPRLAAETFLDRLSGDDPKFDWGEVLTLDIQINCRGNAQTVPFAGCFDKQRGFERWLRLFKRHTFRPSLQLTDACIAIEGQFGFIHLPLVVHVRSVRSVPIDFEFRLNFQDGLISQVIVLSDTLEIAQLFSSAQQLLVVQPA